MPKQQSYLRDFSHYTFLSVLGTLGVSCYILADTFFVSKGLGTNGLAALNLAIPVYNFIHGSGLMIGMGGATKFSVMKNNRQDKIIDKIYTHTVYLSVFFSLLFVLTGMFLSEPLAVLLGADTNVLAMTNTYLRWLLLFAPAFIFNDVFLCFVRNDGNPQLAMSAMLIGSFSNIILDYVFIFPMNMGIFGAVFATGLSPIISMVIMLPHWLKKHNSFHLTRTKLQLCIAGQELSLGFPSLIAQVSSGIVMIIFNAVILNLEGNTGVAAYGIIANISLVIVAVFTGIAQGVQPLISNFYGTGNRKQVYVMLRYSITAMLIISAAVYLLLYVFAQPISAIFNNERNLELEKIAVAGIKLYFLSIPFVGYNIILSIFFTSIEKALPAHILSILRGLVLIIPVSFLLSALLKMTGIWLTYPITELTVAIIGYVIYKSKGNKLS